MHPELERSIARARDHIEAVPEERKELLDRVAGHVSARRAEGQGAKLTFICTHNSRRSQMGQLWAAAAAAQPHMDASPELRALAK